MLRDLVQAFEPRTFKMNTSKVSTDPQVSKIPPICVDLIAIFAGLVPGFWEPYGLRQRHRVMMYFYPEESRRRSHDLHDTILINRSETFSEKHSCQTCTCIENCFLEHFFKARCKEARLLNAFESTQEFKSCATWLNSRLNWYALTLYLNRFKHTPPCRCLSCFTVSFIGRCCTLCNKPLSK